jgi:hypothetical protein
MEKQITLDPAATTVPQQSALPSEAVVNASTQSSRLARHILNTFHSARKAYADETIEDRLAVKIQRVATSAPSLHESVLESLHGFRFSAESPEPEVAVRYDGAGPVRVTIATGALRIPEGAHALVADLWYAAPDWNRSYPEAVRHTTVQLPMDAGMAGFEFFPEKTNNAYILIAGLRWHLDFRHKENFSREPGTSNAIVIVMD